MARHFQHESDVVRQPFVRCAWGLTRYYALGYHRINVLSPCPMPRKGPGILVCNHISGLDPVLLQALCPRLIVWMMAREYYEQAGIHYGYRRIEAIPVNRTGRDLAATRMALRALEEGRIVGIFPEGAIATEPGIQPFEPGAALLAGRSGAPVYPACIEGTFRGRDVLPAFVLPGQVTAAFANPLILDTVDAARQGIDQATLKIQEAVGELHRRICAWQKAD